MIASAEMAMIASDARNACSSAGLSPETRNGSGSMQHHVSAERKQHKRNHAAKHALGQIPQQTTAEHGANHHTAGSNNYEVEICPDAIVCSQQVDRHTHEIDDQALGGRRCDDLPRLEIETQQRGAADAALIPN